MNKIAALLLVTVVIFGNYGIFSSDDSLTLQKCRPYDWVCRADNKCYPNELICDGTVTCQGASEEKDCIGIGNNGTCADFLFGCDNGQCIPKMWVCDGGDNCGDYSDEINCKNSVACPQFTFQCESGDECLTYKGLCHPFKNCTDMSDERFCEKTPKNGCPPGFFQCQNRKCIPESWRCDKINQCLDEGATDELNCRGQGSTTTPSLNPQPTVSSTPTTSSTSFTKQDENLESTTFITTIIISTIAGALILLALLALGLCFYKRRQRKNHLLKSPENLSPDPPSLQFSVLDKSGLSQEYIIRPSDLQVDTASSLGEGAFGKVLQGKYCNEAVAIKTIKSSENLNQLREFLHEIRIITKIGNHPHIVKFYGAEISNLEEQVLLVVFELSPYGSLSDFLRKHNPLPVYVSDPPERFHQTEQSGAPRGSYGSIDNIPSSYNTTIPLRQLLSWAEQISRGMAFLQRKNIVHGDLATRNVLVFDNNVIKLTDFGLSRSLYQCAIYSKTNLGPLPWRWMAFESLQAFEFSSKSDVWAYGVTLWEIFTFGCIPFPEHSWSLTFQDLLVNGLRLEKPKLAPTQLYQDIMLPSWELSPSKRPDFNQILNFLTKYQIFIDVRNNPIHGHSDYENVIIDVSD